MDNVSNVNFKANYIKSVNIKKFDGKEYRPCKASFVELTSKDYNSIDRVVCSWNQLISYKIANSLKETMDSRTHFYAVTTQDNNFDKLEPKKVQSLSLVEDFSELKLSYLKLLQVNPKSMSPKNGSLFSRFVKNLSIKLNLSLTAPKYKSVGAETIKGIREEIDKENALTLHSAFDARGFYKKIGMVNPDDKNPLTFVYKVKR